jgi:integrase/recombinase XerD
MNMRRFARETQHNYIRDVGRFATFLGRAPNTTTVERQQGVRPVHAPA